MAFICCTAKRDHLAETGQKPPEDEAVFHAVVGVSSRYNEDNPTVGSVPVVREK
jgi:hypothetical protein